MKKFECIGHVPKRVGTRLRKLKQRTKGLAGKGKLTSSVIDKLQNYYGIAIRQNVENKEGMKKAIHASLFHVASSSKNNWHNHCREGSSSWCPFKQDQANCTSNYKPGAGLPLDIVAQFKPIYNDNDLSSSELLYKCLHGKTQNQNESLNAMLWERIAKTTYVSFNQLQLGTYDSVANFNIGRKASFLILSRLGIEPGKYTARGCATKNKKRLEMAGYKNRESSKTRRKVIRGLKKRKEVKDVQKEGITYESGAFHQ